MYGFGLNTAGEPIVACSSNEDYSVYAHEKNVFEYYKNNILSEKEKIVYDEIYESYLQFRPDLSTKVETLSATELDRSFKAVYLDHPEIFWIKSYSPTLFGDKVITSKIITLNYYYSEEQSKLLKAEVEKVYTPIINEANTFKTDEEKVKFVYDKLIEMGTYTNDENVDSGGYQSFISIFKSGKTVCTGFSYSFKFLMDNLGIESITISNLQESIEDSHVWNMVKLNNTWYNLDLTYDDKTNSQKGYTDYEYYLKDNEEFYKTHKMQSVVPEN